MTPIDIQVSRSKVKVKGHASLLHLVQLITQERFAPEASKEQKRSTEGCSKFKSPETRQVKERLVSTLEHMQVPKRDRTRCPEE